MKIYDTSLGLVFVFNNNAYLERLNNNHWRFYLEDDKDNYIKNIIIPNYDEITDIPKLSIKSKTNAIKAIFR